MKLGTQTGSLINHIMAGETSPAPKVGDGATELCWTDRHPYTIVAISASGKTVTVRRDVAKRIDSNGMSESQEYEYSRDPNGSLVKLRQGKDGAWKHKGRYFRLGEREEYYDHSF